MKTFFNFSLLFLLFSSFIFANGIHTYPIEKTVVVVVNTSQPTTWTNGDINQYYLDFAHTQKTFDDIKLDVGTYSYSVETIKRNNQPGKLNFDITVKYQNGSDDKKVDQQFSPGTTKTGSFVIEDYKSQSGGAPSGYGMLKVKVGRADHNTNLNYKITLTKTSSSGSSGGGGIFSGGNRNGSNGTNNSNNNNNTNNDCNYSDLGDKTGNVIGNTVGKYTSTKKACKNTATVRVNKTDGQARTTILVYASNTANSQGTLIKSDEFPNGNGTGSKTLDLTGVNNKFITVELKNRSATNQFKYNLSITQ